MVIVLSTSFALGLAVLIRFARNFEIFILLSNMLKRKKKGDFKSNTRTPASPPPPESFEGYWIGKSSCSILTVALRR